MSDLRQCIVLSAERHYSTSFAIFRKKRSLQPECPFGYCQSAFLEKSNNDVMSMELLEAQLRLALNLILSAMSALVPQILC